MRYLYIIFILFHLAVASYGQSFYAVNPNPKYEVRAVWLTTIGGIDWPHSYAQSERSAEKQKEELRAILDRLQKANINTILLQTRIRATTIYPSQYEPWDGCLSGFPGKSPGYDALQFAIDECHKRGMEVHAWVVTIPVGKWNSYGCRQLRKRFPRLIKRIDQDGYMDPEATQTGCYLAEMCREIVQRYDVDGIHLDYIRYPETWKFRIGKDQARGNITRIVEKIHQAVKKEKPWVKMSCSPIGKFDDLSRYWSHGWNAYTKVAQDAQAWLKDGLMDELFPMMYFRGDQFFPFAIDWKEHSYGKIIAPGLGIYFLDPKEGKWNISDITSELYHLRNIGEGHAFFRNKFLLDNHQGVYDFVTAHFNRYPALVPPMTWESNKRPQQPVTLCIEENEGTTTLRWDNSLQYEDGTAIKTPSIYNNVYASKEYPVDVHDARNLILTRTTRRQLTTRTGNTPTYYAVTTTDGFGNESRAKQLSQTAVVKTTTRYGKACRLTTTGESIILPSSIHETDCQYIIVKNMQEQAVYITKPQNREINIKKIKDGIYTLNCVNYRNIEHTLGTFIKKGTQKKQKKVDKKFGRIK
uniref:glycoside hydrolase family 10 protein n=1 Tax=Prevotella sp. TaxID=59823 RepID=UPI003FEFCDB3